MRAERLSRLAALEAGHRAASSAPPLSICDGDGDAEEDEEEAARRDGCAARLPLVPDGLRRGGVGRPRGGPATPRRPPRAAAVTAANLNLIRRRRWDS